MPTHPARARAVQFPARVVRRLGAALCGVGLSIGTLSATAAQWATEWHDLRPATVAEAATIADNPFETLSAKQIELLRRLIFSRNLEARGAPVTVDVVRTRSEWARQLAEPGLDADALLARRDALIAERRAATESVNAALERRAVSFLGDGSVTLRSAYLIDGAAMASTQTVARRGP